MIQKSLDLILLTGLRFWTLAKHPRLAVRHWRFNDRKSVPDPAFPRALQDKWLWRKVFDRSPTLTRVTDKLGVRDWLNDKGIEASTPTVLWVGNRAENIPEDVLGSAVVIKANHGWNMNIFLDKAPENREAFDAKANGFLKSSHGRSQMQWAYFDIEPKLFVEEMVSNLEVELKFYCFGSKTERLITIFDKLSENDSADVWVRAPDGGWMRSKIGSVLTENRANRPIPDCIVEAERLAQEIGSHFDHIRVDFLYDGQQLYLGELTVYNLGGHFVGIPEDEAASMNAAWDIRNSWFLTTPQKGWRRIYANALRRRLNARSA